MLIAAIPLFLMSVPLLVYTPLAIFRFKLFLNPIEHLLFIAPFATVTLFGVALMTQNQSPPRRAPLPPSGGAARFLAASAWALWIGFLLSYLTLVLPVLGYLQGDFQSARELMAFPGVGVLYRVYMIALPVLLFYERRPSVRLTLVLSTAVLTVVRAVIYSERSALIELFAVMAVCHYFQVMRVRPRVALGAGLLFGVVFVFTFAARIDAQSRRDPANYLQQAIVADGPVLASINSSAIYYADTQNKAYGLLLGDLPRFYTKRILQVFNIASTREDIRLGVSYAAENAHTGYTSSALTNPGGLTEDISDFGKAGVLISAMKFLLAAALMVRAKADRTAFILLPFLLTWALEYPRFNYYYLPFVAALILCSVGWMSLSYAFAQGSPRSARRPTGAPRPRAVASPSAQVIQAPAPAVEVVPEDVPPAPSKVRRKRVRKPKPAVSR